MHILANLIDQFNPEKPNFRPTEIYNENWMLKTLLHQASSTNLPHWPLSFLKDAKWFSEAMLPTAFKARYRGDKLAESRTNADAVIGHFQIGAKAKADFELKQGASQFVVVEAKINSPLSSRTSNAPGFDQAARNVACMAEVLFRANTSPSNIEELAFILIAPEESIDLGNFSEELKTDEIRQKIQDRVAMYDGDLDEWYNCWVEPTLDLLSIHALSWEQAINHLDQETPDAASSLQEFYTLCLKFN